MKEREDLSNQTSRILKGCQPPACRVEQMKEAMMVPQRRAVLGVGGGGGGWGG